MPTSDHPKLRVCNVNIAVRILQLIAGALTEGVAVGFSHIFYKISNKMRKAQLQIAHKTINIIILSKNIWIYR